MTSESAPFRRGTRWCSQVRRGSRRGTAPLGACTVIRDGVPAHLRSDAVSGGRHPVVLTPVTCGFLTVLENRSEPDETPSGFVTRIQPPGGDPAPDPVLILGSISADSLLCGTRSRRPAGQPQLVLVDTLGTGHSEPTLACPKVQRLVGRSVGARLSSPNHRADLQSAAEACHERLTGEGIDLSAYNVGEMGADVEDVRRGTRNPSMEHRVLREHVARRARGRATVPGTHPGTCGSTPLSSRRWTRSPWASPEKQVRPEADLRRLRRRSGVQPPVPRSVERPPGGSGPAGRGARYRHRRRYAGGGGCGASHPGGGGRRGISESGSGRWSPASTSGWHLAFRHSSIVPWRGTSRSSPISCRRSRSASGTSPCRALPPSRSSRERCSPSCVTTRSRSSKPPGSRGWPAVIPGSKTRTSQARSWTCVRCGTWGRATSAANRPISSDIPMLIFVGGNTTHSAPSPSPSERLHRCPGLSS